MTGLASASDLAALAALLIAIVGPLAVVVVAHIRRTPARLIAQAELERARAGLPSTVEVRLNIDLEERETISSSSAGGSGLQR